MSDALPKKRVRRGIDKDREDERESLIDRAAHHPPPSLTTSSVKKNPSRAVPDHAGFYGLSSAEIGNDSKDIETASSMMTVTHEKTKQEKDKERDKNKNSCGVVKKTLRPPCAPESTLFKKIQRYFHWANDPSLIPEDLKAYKEVVDKLHGELLELEMESIRWHANVNTVRAEFSNMESSLACQILEQESMESELYALLLREFASVEEVVKGDGSHSTRGKAAMTVEDVAARLASVDSVLTGQLEACVALTQAPLEQPEGDPEEALQGGGRVVDVVTDPLTGDVLLCSFQPPTVAEPEKADTLAASITDDSVGTTMEVVEEESLQSNATDTVVVAEVIGSVVDKVEVVAEKCGSSSLAESKDEEGQEVSSSVSSSAGPLLSSDTGLVEAAPPQLPAIVAYVEAKKRKIHEMKAADVFSETLHQGNGLLYALSLPDEVDRPHNYFKVKRLAGTEPPLGDRQRSEVEAQVSASKYSAAPLTAYMSLLQHPYKAGALEGLGQRPCPSTEGAAAATAAAAAAAATSSLKGRGRGGKASAGGGGGASSQSHGHSEAAVAMHMDALRRTPCEVPLVLSPFSSLEGWYAGTYQALAFPLPTPSQTQEQEQGSASRTATPSIEYNIENQEHFIHPQFIQVGEKYMSIINTLSSATQRAQIELADLEKEEAEWKAQVNASGAALHKAQESLSAVQDGWRGQQGCLGLGVGGAGEAGSGGALNGAAVGGTPGTGAGILGAGLAGAGLLPSSSASSSERDGLLGLLGMSAGNGNGDLNGSAAANKKLLDSKKSAAKKKAAARRRR